MTKHKNILKSTEITLIIFVWLVLILAPILFREEDYFNWQSILKPLETIIPLFVIFLVNRFLLVPQLLFKKRRPLYLISVTGMILVFAFLSFIYQPHINQRQERPRKEFGEQTQPPPLNEKDQRRPELQNPPHERPGFESEIDSLIG